MIIAFDLFGTIINLKDADKKDIKHYSDQLKDFHQTKVWRPLELPDSWANLRAFPDCLEGLNKLRQQHTIITCSNAPRELQLKMLANNNLVFDHIVPLEKYQIYKPDPQAYVAMADYMQSSPDNFIMVTANEAFGDLEGSVSVGMRSLLIRGALIKDTIDLAKHI